MRTAVVFTIIACVAPAHGEPALGTCPLPAKTGHDPAFGAMAALATGTSPSAVVMDGVVVTLAVLDGSLVGARSGKPDAATFAEPSDRHAPAIVRVSSPAGPTLVAAWIAGSSIELSSSADGGRAWRAGERIDVAADCEVSTGCPHDPFLAAGTAVYIGYSGDAIGTRVRASKNGGATFGPPVTALGGTEAAAVDDGRLHVVAIKGAPYGAWGSADHAVEYTWSGDSGATFARAVRVSGRDDMLPLRFARPAIASDPRRGWLYIAYVRGGHDGVWEIVVASSKDKGSTWSRSSLGDRCTTRIVPALAVDPTTGTLHVAWLDNAGGGRFAHAVCPAGAAKCVEQGAIGEPFTLALDGSAGTRTTLIVDDKRRQLHAVWTQPPSIAHAVAKLR